MNEKQKWEILSKALDTLIDLEEAERQEYIEKHFGNNPPIRDELKKLLHAYEASTTFLEDPASYFEPVEQQRIQSLIGRHTGSYRILRYLESGGMADIYLASRDDQLFEKTVAVKFLSTDPAASEALLRFDSERNILARLDHPNMARLIDAGVLDDRPYFIMEYVEGNPIDRYLAEHNPDLTERLNLFCQILDAVQYAHQNLVIHCDLKPSNIFVDGEGRVKLLDFGISRWIKTGRKTDQAFHNGLLTLEYAAPEQIRQEPVTIQTDNYALGLLLFVILTGRHPFKKKSLGRKDLEKAICNQAPNPPSSIAANHESDRYDLGVPAVLPSQLQGDIDCIILKALSKTPESRYKTAAEFADDISKFLQNRPVDAVKGNRFYRMGKFISRHKTGSTFTAIIILLLAAYGITLQVQNRIITAEKEKSAAVTEFITDLFSASNPYLTEGSDTLQVRTLLHHASNRLGGELETQPEVRAELYHILGKVNQGLGQYDEALNMVQHALEDQQPESLDDQFRHQVLQARLLVETARFDEARELLEHLEDNREGMPPEEQAGLYSVFTEYHFQNESYDKALEYTERALDFSTDHFGEHHRTTLDARIRKAVLLRDQSEFERADRIFTELLEMYPVDDVTSTLQFALLHNHYAGSLHMQQRFEEAIPHFREAITIREEHLGEDHPSLASSLNNLSSALQSTGNFNEALEISERVLSIYEESYGPEHHYYGTSLSNHGVILRNLDRFSEAEETLSKALAIRKSALGEQNTEVANTYYQLANLNHAMGNFTTADSQFETAYKIMTEVVGDRHPGVGHILKNWGLMKAQSDNIVQARELLSESLEVHEDLFGKDHPSTTAVADQLEELE